MAYRIPRHFRSRACGAVDRTGQVIGQLVDLNWLDEKGVEAGSLGQTVAMWKLATGAPIKNLRFDDISYNSVAFSPQGYWLALGSRDLQLWLKVVLTPEEYARVKAGEIRNVAAASARPQVSARGLDLL